MTEQDDISVDIKDLLATLNGMLNERLNRQRSLQAAGINTSFNEGWIDALEHVVGIVSLRLSAALAENPHA